MKKNSVTFFTIIVFLLSFLTVPTFAVPTYSNSNRDAIREDSATNIVIGTPIKESTQYNAKVNQIPYTVMEFKIDSVQKTSTELKQTIFIYYEGGEVNGEKVLAYRTPWGKISLELNKKVKLYLAKGDTFSDYYYVIGYETLEKIDDKMMLDSPSSYYMYEYYGAGFEWTGIYYTDCSDIDYYLTTYQLPEELEEEDWESAIDSGFTAWNNAGDTDIDFDNAGTRYSLAIENDYNEIGWIDLDWSVVGVCILRPEESNEKTEFDICLNIDHTWCIGSEFNEYDVQNCITHEAGHAIGLDDLYLSPSSSNTMYGIIAPAETKKRTLTSGDENGAQFVAPDHAKPSVSISEPDEDDDMDAYTGNDIIATASVTEGSINNVKFKVTDDILGYESSWTSMSYSGGQWSGSWNPGSKTGYYYITVRAESSYGNYGYDTVRVYCPGPI